MSGVWLNLEKLKKSGQGYFQRDKLRSDSEGYFKRIDVKSKGTFRLRLPTTRRKKRYILDKAYAIVPDGGGGSETIPFDATGYTKAFPAQGGDIIFVRAIYKRNRFRVTVSAFEDENLNGIWDDEEKPIKDLVISLRHRRESDNKVVVSERGVTDKSGKVSFKEQTPRSTYFLELKLNDTVGLSRMLEPDHKRFGNDNDFDPDGKLIDLPLSASEIVEVGAGVVNKRLLALVEGTVWIADQSGARKRLRYADVSLTRDNEYPVSTTRTNKAGTYQFWIVPEPGVTFKAIAGNGESDGFQVSSAGQVIKVDVDVTSSTPPPTPVGSTTPEPTEITCPPTPPPSAILPTIDLEELCKSEVIELFTDPGRVTAAAPDLLKRITVFANVTIIQQPDRGEFLAPGQHEIAVQLEGGDPLCMFPVVVTLDPDSGVIPEVSYISAGENGEPPLQGEAPTIEIGDLVDELGNPVKAEVFVDGNRIDGFDLNEASELYAESGFHVTTIEFTDAFGRNATFAESEWFKQNTTEESSCVTPAQSSTVSPLPTPGPSPSPTPIQTPSQLPSSFAPTTEECTCELERKKIGSVDCDANSNTVGDGTHDYKCEEQKLQKLTAKVSDYGGRADSHSVSDSSERTDEFEIVCKMSDGTKVADCKTCCPNPVILLTVRARIGGLRVYTEDKTDRAFLEVSLGGSGIGDYSVNSAIASGFETYELVNGITVGANAGIGTSDGGSASAALSGSTSVTTTYRGTSDGYRNSLPIATKSITSWIKDTCSKDHTLSMAFRTELLADTEWTENTFGYLFPLGTIIFTPGDYAESYVLKEADIIYSKSSFRCDGSVPKVGVVGGK